jgi:hypothetical protein
MLSNLLLLPALILSFDQKEKNRQQKKSALGQRL